MANKTWIIKQVPLALTWPRKDCSNATNPAFLPENLLKGSGTKRVHPEPLSSQPKILTPAMV